ncbi:MAG: hypothetical protein ACOYM2_03125 [Rectinemataceae bacterium]
MRVCIVYISAGNARAIASLSKAMAKAFEARGHEVEAVEGARGASPRIGSADYLVLGVEGLGFLGKLPPRLAELLAQSGGMTGKRSMAFVRKRGFFAHKTLARLMKTMEAQGMNVNYGELLASTAEAVAAGRAAPVERPRP